MDLLASNVIPTPVMEAALDKAHAQTGRTARGRVKGDIRSGMKTLAIIPARGNSKGIPRKNMHELCGKPLLYWTIAAAQQSHVDNIVVSSEDNDILSYAAEFKGVTPLRRPAEFATDAASTDSVLVHVLKEVDPDNIYGAVVTLQPTSPIRPPGLIDACVKRFLELDVSTLLTMTDGPQFVWTRHKEHCYPHAPEGSWRTHRQNVATGNVLWAENGAVYVSSCALLRTKGVRVCRAPGDVGCYAMPRHDSVEIDDYYDLWLAEKIMLDSNLEVRVAALMAGSAHGA
jgi:CMP-N,N'-diacetyllegionaminic acid synthase